MNGKITRTEAMLMIRKVLDEAADELMVMAKDVGGDHGEGLGAAASLLNEREIDMDSLLADNK